MPAIVEYDIVVSRMRELGLRSQYFNSGAFGFERETASFFTGWMGPPDPTIRPAALAHARQIDPPFEQTLTFLTLRAWRELLPGNIWLMPRSNWAYELDFGSKLWMPDALRSAGLDPAPLYGRTDSPAIEFTLAEAAQLKPLVQTLLEKLFGSDFALVFPDCPAACTLHHHKQVWWISNDEALIERLADLPGNSDSNAEGGSVDDG